MNLFIVNPKLQKIMFNQEAVATRVEMIANLHQPSQSRFILL